MLAGVPDHVDGRMLAIAESEGARVINRDRMWHYTEGVANFAPIWTAHGIRIIPGPSSLWFDVTGRRLPPPLFPGFDTLATLRHLCEAGHGYSWFVLNRRIIAKEFALSGSEQNPDLTEKSIAKTLGRVLPGAVTPVAEFQRQGEDFLTAGNLDALIGKMQTLAGTACWTAGGFAGRSRRATGRSPTASPRMPRSRPCATLAAISATSWCASRRPTPSSIPRRGR
jgi:hypothetical protein